MTSARPLVVIIGPPGAGKTRVGKRVAGLLHCRFVDTDRRIVDGHGSIPELFSRFGEEHFRAIERVEVAKSLGEDAVVALGGGAILNADTRRDLTDLPVALLTVSREAVQSRISGTGRPLLADGLESWDRLVADRNGLYRSLATRTWDTSGHRVEDLAREVAQWTQEQRSQDQRRQQQRSQEERTSE
ncbi:shikimate kinase [Parafrigoribacterium mesophilum]|uniref:shikimate kinase n=1 Tax=Parafrigoribacterium mesophilum TaxID=433646 RepID=UPI0031FD4C0F